ncbi:MAG: DUF7217 family protein [Marinomonas sp.]
MSNKASMLEDINQTHKHMAKAFRLTALLDDECMRPLPVQLAEPEVSQVLVKLGFAGVTFYSVWVFPYGNT